MKYFTDEIIKQKLIENRPSGFKFKFTEINPPEPHHRLLKMKRDGKPFGRLLIWQVTGNTVVWIGDGYSNQYVFESIEGAMFGLKLLLGMI